MTSKNKVISMIYFPILIIYLEVILKLSIFKTLFNIGFVNMVLFSIPIGLIIYLICTNFNESSNRILFRTFTIILMLLYGAQLLYYSIFSTFASLYFFIGLGKATQFIDVAINAVRKNILPLILIFLPLLVLTIANKKLKVDKSNGKLKIKLLGIATVVQVFVTVIVQNSESGALSSRYLYFDAFLLNESVNRFGLLTSHRLDVENIYESKKISSSISDKRSFDNVYAIETGTNNIKKIELAENKYNVLNIDFNSLAEIEENNVLKEMHKYFATVEPTKINEYTGKFKGKNLILITAEGFSPYAIDKEITPTLYKMYNEGFKFTNFYTPLWGVSTTDGEYTACTGLIPKSGVWSFYESSDNYMPFAMGNQLKKLGYSTYAYHNNYFDYYFRNESHPNIGYEYKGLGNGLNITETWPESDLEMIELTVPEYINKEPFHAYYMTVSGHMEYDFNSNYIAYKNKDIVENLNCSEGVKAYLACNIELDKAMESLIKQLEEAGKAENTLIAISPDHYPYGLEVSEINELAGHDVETNFELYKSVFLLWSKGMEPVTIDKVSSSLDIIPTLSNLMGVDYDSRLLMGRDILSDSKPLVLFNNRSWITDKAYFNAETNKFFFYNGKEDLEYINKVTEEVKNKFKYSELILDWDYYRRCY